MDLENEGKKLGDVYTFAEAATKLRVGRKALSNLIREHGYYSKNGRVYRFSDADILAIWQGMRACGSISNGRAPFKSVARKVKTTASSTLQKLLTRRPRKRSG